MKTLSTPGLIVCETNETRELPVNVVVIFAPMLPEERFLTAAIVTAAFCPNQCHTDL